MRIPYISILLSGLFLSGCATVPSAGLADPNAVIPEDSGLVAVQLVSNAESLGGPISQWTEVIVRRESDNELITIPAIADGMVTTRAYIGALKPGFYRIAGLYSFKKISDTSYTMTAPVSPQVGEFEIEANRLTSLGTLVFQPFGKATQGSAIRYVFSRIPDFNDLSGLVEQRFPGHYARLVNTEPLGWRIDNQAGLRKSVAVSLREIALATLAQPGKEAGSFYLLGRLGQYYFRNNDGSWLRGHVDTPYQLSAITNRSDGTILAGGERGVLFHYQGHAGWKALNFPSEDANILKLGEFSDSSVYALAEDGDAFRLWRSTDLFRWQEVTRFAKQKPGWLATAYSIYTVSFPYVNQRGDQLDIWIDGQRHSYDALNGQLESGKSTEFSRLITQGNGILIGREYSSWSGELAPEYSVDGGTTWTKTGMRTGMFSTEHGIPFVGTNGVMVRTGNIKKFNLLGSGWEEREQVKILNSSNNGASWTEVGMLPKGCGRLTVEASTDSLLVSVCEDGRVMTSTDYGASWTHEFGKTPEYSDFPEMFRAVPPPVPESDDQVVMR